MGNFLSNIIKVKDDLSDVIFSDKNVKSYEKSLKINYRDDTSVSETQKYFRNNSIHTTRKIDKKINVIIVLL